MRYLASRVSAASSILASYQYPQPFHLYLKDFFRNHKKYGSKDRKEISQLCYTYFRLPLPKEETIAVQLIQAISFLDHQAEELERLCNEHNIAYPVEPTLKQYLLDSSLIEDEFMETYQQKNYSYKPSIWAKQHVSDSPGHLGLPGCEKIAAATVDYPYQIQDLSSQIICNEIPLNDKDKVWDACAASGGKSLNLLARGVGEFYLSDIRQNILDNAKKRLTNFGYKAHFNQVDLSAQQDALVFDKLKVGRNYFDTILVDAPCSGSGTWFRNPEHFTYFHNDKIVQYAERQEQIVLNALPFLKPGGSLYYLTCSVFKAENEEVASRIEKAGYKKTNERRIVGFKHQSDSMFMACFTQA